jgi:hypothetical protein
MHNAPFPSGALDAAAATLHDAQQSGSATQPTQSASGMAPVVTTGSGAGDSLPPVVGTRLDKTDEHPRILASAEGSSADDAGLSDDGSDMTMPGRPMAILARRDPEGADSLLAPPKSNPEAAGWRDTIEKTNPMLLRPQLSVDEPLALVEVAGPAGGVDLQEPFVREPTLDFHVEIDAPVDDSPLSFADATEALKTAKDRNAIARIVLRAARTKFQRACLLTVFPDRLVGWMGIGDGMDTDRMRNVVIPRGEKSVFGLVVDSRAHYLGPLAKWPVHGVWVKATGRKIPRSLAAFPILVKGRPVNVLVVDNGHGQDMTGDVGEVLILAQHIARVYESLLTL